MRRNGAADNANGADAHGGENGDGDGDEGEDGEQALHARAHQQLGLQVQMV